MANTAPPALGTTGHAGGIKRFKQGKNGRADISSKTFRRKKRALYRLINDFYKS